MTSGKIHEDLSFQKALIGKPHCKANQKLLMLKYGAILSTEIAGKNQTRELFKQLFNTMRCHAF
jgi:hypothetical protein